MVTDLSDVTFTIPVRYDTDQRVESCNVIVRFLNHHFNTNIIVLEEGPQKRFGALNSKKCKYIFKQTNDPNMHRTKCLNIMAKEADTPIIVNYDADVLFKIKQYIDAVNAIRNGDSPMVFPYKGKFMNMARKQYLPRIKQTLAVNWIEVKKLQCIHSFSVGGAVFWDKKKFIEVGMENQKFKSWGFEDMERIERAKKLGIKPIKIPGVLYHIGHPRLTDSGNNNQYIKQNEKEFKKVKNMSKEELLEYVKTWKWVPNE